MFPLTSADFALVQTTRLDEQEREDRARGLAHLHHQFTRERHIPHPRADEDGGRERVVRRVSGV